MQCWPERTDQIHAYIENDKIHTSSTCNGQTLRLDPVELQRKRDYRPELGMDDEYKPKIVKKSLLVWQTAKMMFFPEPPPPVTATGGHGYGGGDPPPDGPDGSRRHAKPY